MVYSLTNKYRIYPNQNCLLCFLESRVQMKKNLHSFDITHQKLFTLVKKISGLE